MPTDIVMPQMGESIFEGTITKWLKKPGDKVQRDEPLFEISTDKVDAEIPAPAAGILQDIKVAEGSTVQVNTVVGTISADGESPAPKSAAAPCLRRQPRRKRKRSRPSRLPQAVESKPAAQISQPEEEEDHARSSPLVRKIAREHNINLAQVPGTGLGGRITKQDITAFLDRSQAAPAASRVFCAAPAAKSQRSACPRLHSGRPGAHDPDAQDHCAPHDRIAPHQRSRPLHVRGGSHAHRQSAQ